MGLALLLAACGQPVPDSAPDTAVPAPRFTYEATRSAAGAYQPAQPVQRQNWRLRHLRVGDAEAFARWSTDRSDSLKSPVLWVFEDMDAPVNDKGERRTLSLVPVSYHVTDATLVVAAVSAGLGPVTFEGRYIDGELVGTLQIGPDRYPDIRLHK